MRPSARRDAAPWLLSLAGLYWFASSFFLAKRSLAQTSGCDDAKHILSDVLSLSESEIQKLHEWSLLSSGTAGTRSGCWMPRQVDSAIIVVVDALRFDFALYNLPKSFGSRLRYDEHNKIETNSTSNLFQFVADPPTVTM